MSVVALAWLLQRIWRQACLIFGAFLTGLLGFWLLARQKTPLNLPSYIEGSLHLISAYGSAMSVQEPLNIFGRGATVAGGFILALSAHRLVSSAAAIFRQLGAVALLAGYTFVMWKHGFVRADGHVG